ncbi:Fur family transcriptional regulator [uncultured Corynebacterium sp.]|uniref:Fur family transcriptional regulator n=1 Tax=uncultured Corynebacterium sp. TaxID=159447 RepID=UPI0025FFDAF3|nr:Fur family transcriptional regulator [uncultured Corynebacterium sp.]
MRTEQTPTWTDRVRGAGLKATPGRVAALEFLHSHPHSTAAEVHAGIHTELPSVSMQSVHNVVNDLSAHGLLRRIDLPGAGGARYETETGDNHHHAHCVVCGRIDDIACVIGEAPCLTPSEPNPLQTVLTADVTFHGICTDCADREDPVTGATTDSD